jgi:hypothetical protein
LRNVFIHFAGGCFPSPAMSGNQSCSRAIMPGSLHLSHRLTGEYLEQIFSARPGRLSGRQGGFSSKIWDFPAASVMIHPVLARPHEFKNQRSWKVDRAGRKEFPADGFV